MDACIHDFKVDFRRRALETGRATQHRCAKCKLVKLSVTDKHTKEVRVLHWQPPQIVKLTPQIDVLLHPVPQRIEEKVEILE